MAKEKYTFELCRGFTLDDHFVGTFQDALLRGDRLASRVGNVNLHAYNEDFHTWEPVGTFLGHMRLKFQSTRPRGARPGIAFRRLCQVKVSIHAPTWGATQQVWANDFLAIVSIHAPTWGATA